MDLGRLRRGLFNDPSFYSGYSRPMNRRLRYEVKSLWGREAVWDAWCVASLGASGGWQGAHVKQLSGSERSTCTSTRIAHFPPFLSSNGRPGQRGKGWYEGAPGCVGGGRPDAAA